MGRFWQCGDGDIEKQSSIMTKLSLLDSSNDVGFKILDCGKVCKFDKGYLKSDSSIISLRLLWESIYTVYSSSSVWLFEVKIIFWSN